MTQPSRTPAAGGWLRWITPDGRRLLFARVLRTFAYGYLSVVLGVYLDRLGLDPTRIGVVLTSAIAGSAVMTVGWSLFADRYGRRRTISTMAVLMAVGGLAFALTDSFVILVLAGFTGTISATNSEVGVFQTIDQAMLPQTAPDARRTWLFSVYNTLATFGGALGALFAASVGVFERLGLTGADAYRPLFVLYALVGLANLALFSGLTDKLELARVHGERRFLGIHRSRGTVAKLAALFGLDAFAGALVVQSLVAYWFYLRWGLDPAQLAVLFFAVNVLSGLSLLAAGWLAARFGLLNTMVFTHLPSNVFLMLVPVMPTAALAVAIFLCRMSISQMDVPTRQSYTMAVVDPDERTATAGLTNVARTASSAFSPLVTGLAFAAGSFALPFVLAGALKIAYDGLVYVTFRGVRPPEEGRSRQ
ncbi:MAG TPA: MFS transporter [Candidatus Limnocylindria bacterium]|nr:MFS transporter [Candidatus Limnocylindria bacterium]